MYGHIAVDSRSTAMHFATDKIQVFGVITKETLSEMHL